MPLKNAFYRILSLAAFSVILSSGPAWAADTKAPSSTITAPSNNARMNNVTFTITGTASDPNPTPSGVQKVEISIDGGAWALATGTTSWSYNWTLPGEGNHTVSSRATDNNNNVETNPPTVNVTVDRTPPSGSVTINSGNAATNSTAATLTISATDTSTVARMRISNDGVFDAEPWENYASTKSWTLSGGDGLKTVYIQFMDGTTNNGSTALNDTGNVSASFTDTITLDTTVPTGSVLINNGDATTNNTAATLTISASDGTGSGVSQMQLSNDGVFDTEPWEAYNASKAWTLTSGDGLKTVYIRFTDIAGNNSSIYSDTITLTTDSTAPVSAITDPAPGAYIRGASYTMTGTASDTGTGVQGVEVSIDGGAWQAASGTASWSYDWNALPADGSHNIRSRATDNSSNVETPDAGVDVTVDNAAPSGLISINNGDTDTYSRNVTLALSASDATSSVSQMQVSNDGVFDTEPWEAFAAAKAWTLDSGNGAKTVFVQFKDLAGNVSSPYSDDITLTEDTAAPASAITAPIESEALNGVNYLISGTASDTGGSGLNRVEVSTDGGSNWKTATGTASWSYNWVLPVKGSRNIKSRAVDNAGNAETPSAGVNVTITAYGSPELQHLDWDASLSGGCANCHSAPGTFLPADYRNDKGFCYSCHNGAGIAHDRGVYGHGHSVLVNVTTGGNRMPTYGDITTSQYNNQPFSRLKDGNKVNCVTCHNVMSKTEDYGRVWEPTTTGEFLRYTYTLQRGGWDAYGYLAPKVYRDTSVWSGPTYSKSKKDYLVDPSEYSYNSTAGTISFFTEQSEFANIYVTLDYAYLRVSSQDNNMCSDCHDQVTHKGNNCLTCHQSHNTNNVGGIHESMRTTDQSARQVRFMRYTGANSFADGDATHDGVCEVCHTTTDYYRRDGGLFANHSSGINYDRADCTQCHSHSTGFAR